MANRPSGAEIHAMRIRKLKQDMEDAKRLGISHCFLHMSALAQNTRRDHAARHGLLYSGEEMLEWWARDGNDLECRCTAIMILTDEQGNPRTPGIIAKVKAALERYNPDPS
ncbi:hypothetical protein ABXV19_08700 [Pseudomonas alkylphenolica]|uniref:hypothetical protein n=1 Tax=Pseudomonas alkylphenolica TaxID=237609 RepID=UPI00339B5041